MRDVLRLVIMLGYGWWCFWLGQREQAERPAQRDGSTDASREPR